MEVGKTQGRTQIDHVITEAQSDLSRQVLLVSKRIKVSYQMLQERE
jgi:hypothetical protein